MKRATVIIGAGFGDEGKGVLTDYFAAKHQKATVVRFNGGAQAGHTVQLPDGRRHVFHHFGAGTLAGANTYLGPDFIANPLLWRKEARELRALGVDLTGMMSVAPGCRVTTPWDMMVNQAVEENRGHGRHGSCGVGIYETVERSSNGPYLGSDDLRNISKIDLAAFKGYSLGRLSGLGINLSGEMLDVFENDEIIDAFETACREFSAEVRVENRIMEEIASGHIIFEGAQGLLLDQGRKDFFPYLTPSKTGLNDGVTWLAASMGITHLDVVYVTRAYATRHGAGPLPHEDPSMSFPDPTNAPNDFQGSLRFAPLDLDLIGRAILDDFEKTPSEINVRYRLAITCLDQVPEDVEFYVGGSKRRGHKLLIQRAAGHITPFLTLGCGPTREDIR